MVRMAYEVVERPNLGGVVLAKRYKGERPTDKREAVEKHVMTKYPAATLVKVE